MAGRRVHDNAFTVFPQQVRRTDLTGEKIQRVPTNAPCNGIAVGGVRVSAENGGFAARASGKEMICKVYAERFIGENPQAFAHYGEHCWGLTASEGPGPAIVNVDGVERRFFDYVGRVVP